MKKPLTEETLCPTDEAGADTTHEWQPLFLEPTCRESAYVYMAQGHADFRQCVRCDAVGMIDAHSNFKIHRLSDSFSRIKKRQAMAWNARQEENSHGQSQVPEPAMTADTVR